MPPCRQKAGSKGNRRGRPSGHVEGCGVHACQTPACGHVPSPGGPLGPQLCGPQPCAPPSRLADLLPRGPVVQLVRPQTPSRPPRWPHGVLRPTLRVRAVLAVGCLGPRAHSWTCPLSGPGTGRVCPTDPAALGLAGRAPRGAGRRGRPAWPRGAPPWGGGVPVRVAQGAHWASGTRAHGGTHVSSPHPAGRPLPGCRHGPPRGRPGQHRPGARGGCPAAVEAAGAGAAEDGVRPAQDAQLGVRRGWLAGRRPPVPGMARSKGHAPPRPHPTPVPPSGSSL